MLYEVITDFEAAIELFERDFELSPFDPNAAIGLGEMLQAATGGYLKATPHRVKSPPRITSYNVCYTKLLRGR